MKKPILIFSLLLFSILIIILMFISTSQKTLMNFYWDKLAQQDPVTKGEVLPADGDTPFAQLKLQNTLSEPNLYPVLTVEHPPITTNFIALTGKIRYDQIQGIGHLGLYIFYSEEDKILQRTIETEGPRKQLTGSSGWRPFILPLNLNESNEKKPMKLEFKVFLADTGTVYLSPIRLVQFKNQKAIKSFIKSLTPTKAWWTGRTAGWMGAIGGTSIGLLGALIGTLNGIGKGKIVVIASLRLLLIGGLTSLGLGVYALIKSQPYAVYYPLLLFGIIGSILPLSLYRTVLNRFDQIKLRKMQAMDTPVTKKL